MSVIMPNVAACGATIGRSQDGSFTHHFLGEYFADGAHNPDLLGLSED